MHNLASAEKMTGANVNVSRFIVDRSKKKKVFQKWPVVGRTGSVVGLSFTMPYPGYATT